VDNNNGSATTQSLPAGAQIFRQQPEDLDVTRNNEATNEFQAKTIELRNQRPQWITYYQSGMIERADYEFMNRFDANNASEREKILSNPTEKFECVKTLLKILNKVSKESTLQYTVTLIDDLLLENKNRVDIFHAYAKKNKENIFQAFVRMLYLQDAYLIHQVCRIVTKLACWSTEIMRDKELKDFIYWIKDHLDEKNPFKDTLCRCLQMLFRIDYYRLAFYQLDGVTTLVKYLDGTLNSTSSKDQMQYQVTFCLWLLTFNEQIANKIQNSHMVIPVLSDILNATEKEKVKRIILATFKNLLEKPSATEVVKANSLCMLQSKVKKIVELMSQTQIEDPDISEDVDFINKKLESMVMDVSTFDEYTLEITTNRLSWSPAHKSDKFWRENAQRLNENNFFLVRKLVELLRVNSGNPQVLEIALNDIGEYVRYYPRGKNVIDQLDAKTTIMSMLSHEDTNVKHQALLCVQKLMVHHWEYLTKIDLGDSGSSSQASSSAAAPKPAAVGGGKTVDAKA